MDITYKFEYESCFAARLVQELNVDVKLLKKYYSDDLLQETIFVYSTNENKLKLVIPYLKDHMNISDYDIISQNEHSVVVKVTTNSCPLLTILKKLDTDKKPLVEKIDSNGIIEWNIELDALSDLNYISDALKTKYNVKNVSRKINKIKKQDPKSEYILHEAYELGYFDTPKRIGLEELSVILHIPPTTLDLILRDSVKKVLKNNFSRQTY